MNNLEKILMAGILSLSALVGCKEDGDESSAPYSHPPEITGPPEISYTYVPPKYSYETLRGQVENVDFSQHRVVTFIKVGSAWWAKPYWNNQLTMIAHDGTFATDITTGGIDSSASDLYSALVTINYVPNLTATSTLEKDLPTLTNPEVKAVTQVTR